MKKDFGKIELQNTIYLHCNEKIFLPVNSALSHSALRLGWNKDDYGYGFYGYLYFEWDCSFNLRDFNLDVRDGCWTLSSIYEKTFWWE